MPNSLLDLTLEEEEFVEDLYGLIPFEIVERGHVYFKKQAVRDVQKNNGFLEANVQGTRLYKTTIDLEEEDFDCTCPADLPCKHVAALTIWTLQQKSRKKKQSAQASKPDQLRDCGLAFVIEKNLTHVLLFAKTAGGKLFKINTPEQLYYLKKDYLPAVHRFLESEYIWGIYFQRTISHLLLVNIINNFDCELPYEFYYEDDLSSPVRFGGIIQCGGQIFQFTQKNDFNGYYGTGSYDLCLYYYDPIQKIYKNTGPNEIGSFNRAVRFRKDQPGLKEMRFHEFILAEQDQPFQSNIDLSGGEEKIKSQFYFLNTDSDYLPRELLQGPWSVVELYKNRENFWSFLPRELRERFNEVWEKGPKVALSLNFDETEEKYKIKGSIEFVYAKQTKDLKPDKKTKEDGITLSHDKILGFPPALVKSKYESIFDMTHQRAIVIRSPKKERLLLQNIDIPFSYRKKTGEFAFTLRFLKKFATEYLPTLKENNILLRLDKSLLSAVKNLYTATFSIEGSSQLDWFEGKIKINGLSPQDTRTILSAYQNKDETVKLSNGEWIVVDQLNIGNIYQALENIGIRLSKDGTSSSFNKGQLIGLDSMNELTIRAEKKVENLKKSFQLALNEDRPPPPLSRSLNARLRPYQKRGVAFFHRLFQIKVGGVLADDMGLGKTVQTIAFMESALRENKKDLLFLVVCPLAALSVWESECRKFAPDIDVQLRHGLHRKSKSPIKRGVLVTTYMTLAQDISDFDQTRFAAVFIDEAQNIKNVKTKASKLIRKLQSDSFFCLTGTPVENYLSDLWSLVDLCFPGLLGTKQAFQKAYGSAQSLVNKDQLMKRLDPFILRRRKQEVLKELPEKSETLVHLPLHDSQSVVYEKIRREAVKVLEDAGSSYLIKMLPYLMRLRRVCCHPDLKNEMREEDLLTSSKLAYLQSKIPEIRESSSGVLVFSQFTDVLKKVVKLLDKEKVDYFYLDGSTTAAKRKKMVQQFQKGEREFFLISLKAGGTALTLHRADTVFHLDPWWNPASENQATDRAHRIGQKRHVFVYKLVAKDTIEDKVIHLQQRKKELFDQLFNEGKNSGRSISKDELMTLLDTA